MRKDEIKLILGTLEKYWNAHSELRLGQIIANMSYNAKGDFDPYFFEDQHLLDVINDAIKQDKLIKTGKIIKNINNKMRK